MQAKSSSSSHPSLVAAYLSWAASQETAPEAAKQRLGELNQWLQQQEKNLPVRAAWMAWCAMYQLSGRDELLLARARDRLLERLFNQGLTPEFDMAGFMRTGGTATSDRFRVLRQQLIEPVSYTHLTLPTRLMV